MNVKKIFSLLLTLLIFTVIFLNINITELKNIFLEMDIEVFIYSQLLLVPLLLTYAYRFRLVASIRSKIGLIKCLKMNLVTYALNVILPSRLGELGKSMFLKRKYKIDYDFGINAVIFEKIVDVLSLCIITIIGILYLESFSELIVIVLISILALILLILSYFFIDFTKIGFFRSLIDRYVRNEKLKRIIYGKNIILNNLYKNKLKFMYISAASFLAWILLLLQTYLFFICLNIDIDVVNIMSLVPIALIIGQIPVTIAGIGTRDGALIFLFSGMVAAELMVGVGLLITLRYIILGLIGSFFIQEYI